MSKYTHILNSPIPQTEPLTDAQVQNNQGGYVWAVDKWTLLRRFLILGSESGTYYVKPRKLTQENAKNVIECIKEDEDRVLLELCTVSLEGKAPKNDAALFTLALVMTHAKDKSKAYALIPPVARTGTHLFQLIEDVNSMRGWSRGLRRAFSNWYLDKKVEDLEYQLLKYKQRNGWSHRDVLRLCHAKAKDVRQQELLSYASEKTPCTLLPRGIAVEAITSGAGDVSDYACRAIQELNLTREMLPTELLNSPKIWEALLQKMPMHATLRSLAKMTSVGLFKSNVEQSTQLVYERLTNAEHVKKSRLHPIAILNALRVYAQGKGDKGKLTWKPNPAILEALDKSFYLSFDNVEPTKKRLMIGLDVSASMDGNMIAGTALDARAASVALSMVTTAVEPFVELSLFSHTLLKGEIPKGSSLASVINATKGIPFGGTDCALPILEATKRKFPIDAFIIYTDSETAVGRIHPAQALREYRKQMGINAKLIVVGMCANQFSIADPNDAGMLDIVGFDPSVPSLIREFILE